MPPGTPAFTATGKSAYPDAGGGTAPTSIDPSIVVPGSFQVGTYNFPGGLEVGGQPVVVSGGALNANEITPGPFQAGTYDFPSIGGLTVAGAPVFTHITANDVNPGTFSGAFNFTQGPTVNNQAVYFRNQGQAQGVLGTDIALDTISGGAGTGVGNIKAATVYGYNVQPGSLTYDLLSGVAQSQILAFTVQDTPFSFLRRVSQTGVAPDANGKETDGFTVANAATRVADPQAYNAYAITNAGMATGVQAVGGPGVPLQPGQYVANVFFRVSAQTGSNVLSVQATGTNVTGPVVNVRGSDLGPSYIGIAVPFTVTAAGASVNLTITNLIASTTAQWWFSHAHADPSTGKATQAAAQYFFASAAITAAQIQNVTADQITSGLINADNIFMGPGGHIYMGPQVGPISGNAARVEINSAGLFAYDGTQQTVAINANGSASFKGDISGATGTFTGSITGASGTFSGSISGAGISGGSISGGAISGGTISGTNISGSTITGTIVETTTGLASGSGQAGIRVDANNPSDPTIQFFSNNAAEVSPARIYMDTSFSPPSFTIMGALFGSNNYQDQVILSDNTGKGARLVGATRAMLGVIGSDYMVWDGLNLRTGMTNNNVDGSYGHVNLIGDSPTNIGYVEWMGPNAVRQGYIGFGGYQQTTDQGTLNYVAATHSFTGQIAVDSVTAKTSGGAGVWDIWTASVNFHTPTHGCSIQTVGGMPSFGSAGQDNLLTCRATSTHVLGSTSFNGSVWGQFYAATNGFVGNSTLHGKADIEPIESGWALDVIRKAPAYRFHLVHGDFADMVERHPDFPDHPIAADCEDWHFGPIYEDMHEDVRESQAPALGLQDLIGVLWANAGDQADQVEELLRRVAALETAGAK